MANVYKSALGKQIDMDQLRLHNEETIAIGNMKVNARGDELGPGGEIIRTRNQVMNDYYKLNTPVINSSQPEIVMEEDVLKPAPPPARQNGLRGSLADSIAKSGKN
jgi:hypothetical protein